jgi:hypothetical protein
MSIVLGTHFYRASADEIRRQDRPAESLVGLRHVVPVNLQPTDDVAERPGLRTVPVLCQDACLITRHNGRRKPISAEVFDALATIAREEGHPYFGFLNADIVVTQPVVDLILEADKETYVFSRTDMDESGRPLGLMLYGMDLFVFDVNWWATSRKRFRPYVLGERCFDNVYTAIMMCHGDGLIVNRHGYLLHVRHQPGERLSNPYGQYNRFLASLDSRYFSLWAEYCERLVELHRRGAPESEERALAKEVFVWRSSLVSAGWQAGRQVKARLRYWRDRAQWQDDA